jgi:hypothetical protein
LRETPLLFFQIVFVRKSAMVAAHFFAFGMSSIIKACSRFLLLSCALLSLSLNLHVIAQVVGPSPARPLIWSANGVENGLKPRFQIDARGANDETIFRYFTVDGTAKAGVDYIASAGTGTNWGAVEITVPNDGKVEPPKTLKLVVIQEETPPKTNTVEVTIFDDEIPRSIDTSFTTDFQPFSSGFVFGMVDTYVSGRVLANGDIVILEPGGFTVLDKNGATKSRHTFSDATGLVASGSAVTPDGKILVTRQSEADGSSVLLQYLLSGQKDESFQAQLPVSGVNCLAVTPEGKIIVSVTPRNGTTSQVIQLNANGSVDSTFAAIDTGTDRPTRIGIGLDSAFQLYFYSPFGLRQLYRDGKLVEQDYSYNVGAWIYPKTPNVWVGDGLVKGVVTYYGTHYLESTSLYRLRADGSLDEAFAPGLLPTQFAYIGTQTDGKVIVFGNGELMRLNPNSEQANRVYIETFYGLEEAEEMNATIRRTGDTTQRLTVRLQVAAGTATVGEDFLPIDTLVTFEPFSSVAGGSFKVLEDDLSEGPETFVARISSSNNDAIIEVPEYVGAINDQERFVRLSMQRGEEGLLLEATAEMTGINLRLESSADLGQTWVDLGNFSNQVTIPIESGATPIIFRAVRVQ